jgi:hypothetical protein
MLMLAAERNILLFVIFSRVTVLEICCLAVEEMDKR